MSKNNIHIALFTLSMLFYLQLVAQQPKRIEILNANSIEFDEKIGKDVKRLLGDVQFKHGTALMYCDSAYLNSKTNILKAFSNVHIIQNDSIDLYGDFLDYNGNLKLAKVRQNVRLIHGNSILTTDSLDYDRKTNIAHYFSWGYLKDQDNDLQSVQGYYYTDLKDYYAIDSVTLTNPDYKIFSDSLRYNTGTNISFFYGPTNIVSDSNHIYCEYGWYDTEKDLAKVRKNSYIQNKEKKLIGDSIFYDKNKSFGEAFSNVAIIDTSAKIQITGNYAIYYEHPDRAFVTQKALLTKYGGEDTLFLHADTLRMYTMFDTLWIKELQLRDTIVGDSLEYSVADDSSTFSNSLFSNISISDQVQIDTFKNYLIDTIKIINSYYHVQIFKADLQVRCDSLVYSSKDSIIRLYKKPIIWSDNQQITADYIELLTENNNPTEMFLDNNAFIVLKDDSVRYNQIKGVNMRAYFNSDNQLYKLRVNRKAESIFFPREEATEEQKRDSVQGDLVGANITQSNSMTIWFENNQPSKITLYNNPKGVLNPEGYKPVEEYQLDNFSWKDYLRPKQLKDIFDWKEERRSKEQTQK